MSELDSFVNKFKNLLSSGRTASLLIKAVAGKAEVKLEVKLGDAQSNLLYMNITIRGPGMDRHGSGVDLGELRKEKH